MPFRKRGGCLSEIRAGSVRLFVKVVVASGAEAGKECGAGYKRPLLHTEALDLHPEAFGKLPKGFRLGKESTRFLYREKKLVVV